MPNRRNNALRALRASPTFAATRRGVAYGTPLAGMGAGAPAVNPAQRAAARAQFVRWLTAKYPKLVHTLVLKLAPRAAAASGLGQTSADLQPVNVSAQTIDTQQVAQTATSSPSLIDNIISAASSILPAYLANQQQKQILNAQLTLAEQGKPPLQTGQYSPTVNVGLSDATIAKIGAQASKSAKGFFSNPWVWGIGAALAGWWLLSRKG